MTETNGKLICHICGMDGTGTCKSCSQAACLDHWSQFDPQFCAVCVQESNTKIEEKPLIDAEGVKHHGRQLILTGESWMRSQDVISKMTDIELELKLNSLKAAVHEAEMILEFRRIQFNQVDNEKANRQMRGARRRRLIETIDQAHKLNKSTPAQAQAKVDVTKDALGALKKLGLNNTAIANVLTLLAKQKPKETK